MEHSLEQLVKASDRRNRVEMAEDCKSEGKPIIGMVGSYIQRE